MIGEETVAERLQAWASVEMQEAWQISACEDIVEFVRSELRREPPATPMVEQGKEPILQVPWPMLSVDTRQLEVRVIAMTTEQWEIAEQILTADSEGCEALFRPERPGGGHAPWAALLSVRSSAGGRESLTSGEARLTPAAKKLLRRAYLAGNSHGRGQAAPGIYPEGNSFEEFVDKLEGVGDAENAE